MQNDKKYDYFKAVTGSVVRYFYKNINNFKTCKTAGELKEAIVNHCYNNQNVTGNSTGSYTNDPNLAQNYINSNKQLATETIKTFFNGKLNLYMSNPEMVDVAIRCYILPECVNRAVYDFILPYKNVTSDTNLKNPQTNKVSSNTKRPSSDSAIVI